jgi:hypothetical protein
MNLSTCKQLMALVLLAVVGCDPKPEIVGATIPTGESGDSDDTTGGTDPTTTASEGWGSSTMSMSLPMTEADDGSSDPVDGAEGSACVIPPEYAGGPTVHPDPGCESGVCMLQAHVPIIGCDGPEDCTYDEHLTGCVDGFCELDTAWAETQMSCTQTCEADVDCPDIPGCASGRACAPVALIGPLCCQKVCTCLDEISQDWVNMRVAQCEAATHCG